MALARALILRALVLSAISIALAQALHAAEPGLISKESHHSVPDTVARFERAVKARDADGWVVFTELDHAAAASGIGLAIEAANRHRVWQPEARYTRDAEGTDACNRPADENNCLAGRSRQGLADLQLG